MRWGDVIMGVFHFRHFLRRRPSAGHVVTPSTSQRAETELSSCREREPNRTKNARMRTYLGRTCRGPAPMHAAFGRLGEQISETRGRRARYHDRRCFLSVRAATNPSTSTATPSSGEETNGLPALPTSSPAGCFEQAFICCVAAAVREVERMYGRGLHPTRGVSNAGEN